jgi:hypothetical protein
MVKKNNKAHKFIAGYFNEGLNEGLENMEAALKAYDAVNRRFPSGKIPPEYVRALEQLCCDFGL